MATSDTIAAIATPNGTGGVGVIRVSGSACQTIAESLCSVLRSAIPVSSSVTPSDGIDQHLQLTPRVATLTDFLGAKNEVIDTGIVLFFRGPQSYTGEDVLELQAHGGSVVLNMLLQRVLSLDARMARPGEFTERAYLNNKLDLSQAEAVSDLINSGSEAAARAAVKSLRGDFSKQVYALTEELTDLRIYMEAALDFPEEEIDFLASEEMQQRAVSLRSSFKKLLATTRQGQLLRDGLTVVIAGKPNAGKSSLLNRLTGEATAIVTDIKGTTRDLLRERIQLDGLPVQLIDTAGLHASRDLVEQEGIRRAISAIRGADRVLWIEDISQFDIDDQTEQLPAKLLTDIEFQLAELLSLCETLEYPEDTDHHLQDTLHHRQDTHVRRQDTHQHRQDTHQHRQDTHHHRQDTHHHRQDTHRHPGEGRDPQRQKPTLQPNAQQQNNQPIIVDIVFNKTDLDSHPPGQFALNTNNEPETANTHSLRFEQCIKLSAATGDGIDLLQTHLKQQAGYDAGSDDVFIARRRHIVALEQAAHSVELGFSQLENQQSPELAAEDFRMAQQALGEITGEVSSDDLLGRIFAGFCIGK